MRLLSKYKMRASTRKMAWIKMNSCVLLLVPTALKILDLIPVDPCGICSNKKITICTVSDIDRMMYKSYMYMCLE